MHNSIVPESDAISIAQAKATVRSPQAARNHGSVANMRREVILVMMFFSLPSFVADEGSKKRSSLTSRVTESKEKTHAVDIHGGHDMTDEYPFAPICMFGVHEPFFGKAPPLRWHDETSENATDDEGETINGH